MYLTIIEWGSGYRFALEGGPRRYPFTMTEFTLDKAKALAFNIAQPLGLSVYGPDGLPLENKNATTSK